MKGKLGTPATLCYLLSGISGYNQDIMKSQRSILSYSLSDKAKFRLEVIKFFEEFGLKPTQKAFGGFQSNIVPLEKEIKTIRRKTKFSNSFI